VGPIATAAGCTGWKYMLLEFDLSRGEKGTGETGYGTGDAGG